MARMIAPALRCAALCLALAAPGAAQAAVYAVVLGSDAAEKGGELHRLDDEASAAHLVSRFHLDGKPVALRGIAIHPKTRVFYGITAPSSAHGSASLVTFDPASGRVTRVGRLGYDASDLNFDASGKLYVWLVEESKLGVINVGTGEARPLEMSGLGETIGGGFAIRGDGTAVLSATSAAGTLDRVSLVNGAVTTGPALRNAPFLGAIVAMDFSPMRALYGVNTSLGPPSPAALVRIDVDSGGVTRMASLPVGTTAIAFGLDEDARRYVLTVPENFFALVAAGFLAALIAVGTLGYWLGRRDRLR